MPLIELSREEMIIIHNHLRVLAGFGSSSVAHEEYNNKLTKLAEKFAKALKCKNIK